MTQNPYPGPPPGWAPPPPQGPPPGPPQGYAYPGGQPDPGYQQAPPYGSPPPQGPPPGQYPQQTQQWPPPAAVPQAEPGAPAGGDEPFSNPGAPQGGGDAPGMHQLEGRLLLIRPTSFDPMAKGYQSNPPGPLVRADVIVCDGPPIDGSINGDTNQKTLFAAGPKVAPFFCGAMYIRGAVLPGQLEPFVGSRGQVLARLVKGQQGKQGRPPWLLADPNEQDKVIGRQIHAQWDAIVAASQPPRPDQFAAPQGQQGPPPGWAAQNPYGAPPEQPQYPQAPAQPAYGQPPQGYPQQAPPPGYGPPPGQGYPQAPPPGQYPPY